MHNSVCAFCACTTSRYCMFDMTSMPMHVCCITLWYRHFILHFHSEHTSLGIALIRVYIRHWSHGKNYMCDIRTLTPVLRYLLLWIYQQRKSSVHPSCMEMSNTILTHYSRSCFFNIISNIHASAACFYT